MLEQLQQLPENKQRMVRTLALTMEGPSQYKEPVAIPITALGMIIWALWALCL